MMSAIGSVISRPPPDHSRAAAGEGCGRLASVDVLERRRGEPLGQLHARRVDRAVTVRDLVEVLLVVVLGEVERRGRRADDLGRDRAVAVGRELLLEHVATGLRQPPLLIVLDEDRGPVLSAPVVALAHALRRVVVLPEDPQQLLVGRLRRIEHDPDGPCVAGPARAGLLVRGVGRDAALVAHGGRPHARLLPEGLLFAPEAAERELRDLETLGIRPGDGRTQDGVVLWLEDRGRATGQRLVCGGHGRLEEVEESHAPTVRPSDDVPMTRAGRFGTLRTILPRPSHRTALKGVRWPATT